ncbi:formate dehydrogenase subunit gamma [Sphaerotilus mobilis]|uniref:Formate dehydrogenase gamma subunit n=1 Tax=Sphaerotilus mobilis TaxID=47994 RepID=A0A4Q7LV49_9BURK|nr:formate dehydrogenase subunit gamma [Sphaerotilus mobilis]RZS58167.1 formate dehydrogenase gamma subunit [Sphaerotilus mobilis]
MTTNQSADAPTFPLNPAQEQALEQILAAHAGQPGALLPILHDVQHAFGHVPRASLAVIARALNLSRAEVHGVVTYYDHFRTEPAGRHVIQVCRAEACQARGSEALWAHACQRTGCDEDRAHSADGQWTLEPVYCLGLCASGPSVQVDERLHARVSPTSFDATLAAVEAADASLANQGSEVSA